MHRHHHHHRQPEGSKRPTDPREENCPRITTALQFLTSVAGSLAGSSYNWEQPWQSLTPSAIVDVYQSVAAAMQWDVFSVIYVVVGAILFLVSYLQADGDRGSTALFGLVLATPALLIGALLVLQGALVLLVALFGLFIALLGVLAGSKGAMRDFVSILLALVPVLIGLAACFLYSLIFYLAAGGSAAVSNAWSTLKSTSRPTSES